MELEGALRRLRGDAVLFVEEVIGAEPDNWQREVLRAISANKRVAVRSGHGVGKTAFLCWVGLWFLATHYKAKIVATAPTSRQLIDILFSELSKWLNRSLLKEIFELQKTSLRLKNCPNEWFLVARTASTPESFAGFHADNLLFIVDEASGVSDEIFRVIEGALTGRNNKLLLTSNPTRNAGFFKRAFYEERELYAVFKVSSAETARVDKGFCERLIKTYGAESDVVRVRVLGEFPSQEASGLIALEEVEAAMRREVAASGDLVIGVDVARYGDDESVMSARLGDCILPLIIYRKVDLMTLTGRLLHETKAIMAKYKKDRADINIDEGGLGAGVVDRLKEISAQERLHMTINGINFGGKASDKKYKNLVTEMYFTLKERLSGMSLPDDGELSAQLSTRHYSLTSDDKLIIERKSDYKKRIGRSPDRADAVVLSCIRKGMQVNMPQMVRKESYWR